MAGLPRKYAKMGFKRGWKAYKRSKQSLKGGNSKRMVKRRRRRTSYKRTARRRTRRKGGALMSVIIPAMAYGGVREKLSNMLLPITNKIPFGSISDEIVMATITYFISKKARLGILSQVAKAGLIIESARVGEAIADGTAFSGFHGVTANSTNIPVV